jgi:hypothetical protein
LPSWSALLDFCLLRERWGADAKGLRILPAMSQITSQRLASSRAIPCSTGNEITVGGKLPARERLQRTRERLQARRLPWGNEKVIRRTAADGERLPLRLALALLELR